MRAIRAAAAVLAAALALLVVFPVVPEGQQAPQYRGFWVDTFNTRLNTPEDTAAVVARARAAGANALFVQVRRRGDAWYTSGSEPLPEGVSIADGFDPLGDLVGRARGAGLQLHAFAVVGAIWNQASLPLSPLHVFNRHGLTPDGTPRPGRDNWLTRTLLPDTGSAVSYGGHRFGADFWLDFGHPDAVAYIEDALLELVARYDVDGLHLDRIRYPDIGVTGQSAGSGASVGYNDVSLERFRRRHGLAAGAVPAPNDPLWNDWRREQVTALVRRVYLGAMALKPSVTVSAAVTAFGDAPADEAAWTASEPYWRVFQDWRAWAEEGIVDLLVPMLYRAQHAPGGADSFAAWLAWSRAHGYGRHVAIGLGAYLNSVEGTLQQVRRAMEPADRAVPQGVVLFSLGAHNAPVIGNPLALPGPRDTPYRAFEDLAAGLTTGRTSSGQILESSAVPVFSGAAPVPLAAWKRSPQTGSLKGTVTMAGGAPVDGAEIVLEAAGVGEPAGRTDGGGFFGRAGVAPGTYEVLVTPLGDGRYRSACGVTISPGVVSTLDLELNPARPATAACSGGAPSRRR